MPFLQILIAVLFVGGAAAITFWNKILEWVRKSMLPWMDKNLHWLKEDIAEAFSKLDKVIAPIRRAWQHIRKYILKILVQFAENTENEWIKRISYWVIGSHSSKEQVTRVVTEEEVEFDDLPHDVREQLIRKGHIDDIDVTQMRDKELEMSMSN